MMMFMFFANFHEELFLEFKLDPIDNKASFFM